VTAYSGPVTIQANGGKGGDENDAGTTQRCYGAGGGGSGGVIYFTGSIPPATISTNGGGAGSEYGGDPACNSALPASSGTLGSTVSSYFIRQSTDSASYCLSIPLAVRLIYFKAARDASVIQLRWAISNPELAREFTIEKISANDWSPLYTLHAADEQKNYFYNDEHPEPGSNWYRLKIIEKSNSFFYSSIRYLNDHSKSDLFTVYPNPAFQHVTITGDFSSLTEIKLFDLAGKLKWHDKVLNNTGTADIDLSMIQPGMYVLSINNVIKKLVVRK